MAAPLDRTWYNTLIDDDGTGTTGTVWDRAQVDGLLDAVDAALVPVVETTDPRLTDARPPTAHKETHAANGSDPVDVKALAGYPADPSTFLDGTGAFRVPPVNTGPPGPAGAPGPAGPAGSGVAAGITAQVQFNDAGAFAGDAAVVFDKITKLLTMQRPANKIGAPPVFVTPNLSFDLATGVAFLSPGTAGPFTTVFVNPPPTGVEFVFSIQYDIAAACTPSWPASVTWDEDVAPVFPAAGRSIIIGFSTINGGARWRGYIGGRNFAT